MPTFSVLTRQARNNISCHVFLLAGGNHAQGMNLDKHKVRLHLVLRRLGNFQSSEIEDAVSALLGNVWSGLTYIQNALAEVSCDSDVNLFADQSGDVMRSLDTLGEVEKELLKDLIRGELKVGRGEAERRVSNAASTAPQDEKGAGAGRPTTVTTGEGNGHEEEGI